MRHPLRMLFSSRSCERHIEADHSLCQRFLPNSFDYNGSLARSLFSLTQAILIEVGNISLKGLFLLHHFCVCSLTLNGNSFAGEGNAEKDDSKARRSVYLISPSKTPFQKRFSFTPSACHFSPTVKTLMNTLEPQIWNISTALTNKLNIHQQHSKFCFVCIYFFKIARLFA